MKLDEIDILKMQLLAANVTIATQARDAFSAELVRKYGEPGDTSISWQPDGTIVRAPTPLASVPEVKEVSDG